LQLLKQLKKLHQLAAETYEKLYQANLKPYLPDLAYHYDKADNVTKALEYLEKAGNQEKENYRNQKAAQYFDRWTELAEQQLGVTGDDFENLEVNDSNRALVINYVEVNVLRRNYLYGGIFGNLQKSREILDTSLLLSLKLDDKFQIARTECEIGSLLMKQNKLNEAKEKVQSALQVFIELESVKNVITGYYVLGLIAYRSGRIDEAIENMSQSLHSAEKSGEKKGETVALGALGTIYDYKGDQDKAIDYYQRRLKLSEELNDQNGIQITCGNLGAIYNDQQKYDLALQMYEKKMQICQQLGDLRGQMIVWHNIANSNMDMKQEKTAENAYNNALTLAEKLQDYKELALIRINCSSNYRQQSNFSAAKSNLHHAYLLIEQFNLKHLKSFYYLKLAELQEVEGDLNQAIATCLQCIELAQELNNQEYLQKGQELLAELQMVCDSDHSKKKH